MPTAIRRLVRAEDGIVRVVYVDLGTFQPVTNLDGYTTLEPDNGIEDVPAASIPKAAQAISDKPVPPEVDDTEKLKQFLGGEGGGESEESDTKATKDQGFGYIDKPAGMGLASAIPGPVGMMGKVANTAINLNNVHAANKARASLGLPALSKMDTLKGAVMDRGPDVSKKANIGGTDYGIAMGENNPWSGGVMKNGTLGLTPQEARVRSMTLDAPVKEGEVSERGYGYRAQPRDEEVSNIDLANEPDARESVDTTPNKNGTVANMDASYGAKLSTSGVGSHRPATPSAQINQKMQNIVGTTLGTGYTVSLTSGTYAEEKQDAINEARSAAQAAGLSSAQVDAAGKHAGQYGSTRHTTGLAGDYKVFDPMGKEVTDRATLDKVGIAAGEAGLSVGVGPGYMGGTAIHVDDTRPSNPNTWGAQGTEATMDPDVRSSIQEGQMEASRQHNTIAGYKDGIATPADKPGTKQYGAPPGIGKTPNLAGASMAKAAPTTMDEAFEGVTGLGNPTQADAVPAGPMTAASFSATGMGTQYSEQERAQMAKTLAGELGPKTLQGILEGNPEAVAEANAMLGTIDNRVNSITGQKKANPVSGTLVGKQYNANLAKNQKVTLGNYKTFGPALLGVVDDYTKGLTASPAPNATNYVNKSIANPSWSKDATQPVGLHSFGTPFNPGQKLSTKAFGAKTGPVAAIGLGSEPGPITPDAGTAGNALKGTLGVGGGYVSDVGQSGVKTSSSSVNSPGGETGFGRDQGVRGSQGTGLGGRVGSGSFGSKSPAGMGISDAARGGLSGNNSPRGTGVSSPASTGSRVGTGAFGGGYADSSSGAGTKSSPSGISAGSNSPRGMGNQSLGGSSSPSKSGSGSASSASSGNSRGGLSSGRGMGGFN